MIIPLISVIIPVYNVEKYLDRLMCTVLENTYKNLEIICVDDGCTDNCPKMLDHYASIDSRVRVIHQKNSGVSSARNAGIEIASGEYIAFLDSDDWIHIDYFQTLLDIAQKYDADITRCRYISCGDDAYSLWNKSLEPAVVTCSKIVSDVFQLEYLYHSIWALLLKRDVIANIRFPHGLPMGNDAVFSTWVMSQTRPMTFAITDAKLYFYFQCPGSIIRQASPERYLLLTESYIRHMLVADRKDYFLFKAFHSALLCRYVSSFGTQYKHIQKKSSQLLRDCCKKLVLEKRIPLRKKVGMFIRVPSVRIYRAIMMRIEPDFKQFEEGLIARTQQQ